MRSADDFFLSADRTSSAAKRLRGTAGEPRPRPRCDAQSRRRRPPFLSFPRDGGARSVRVTERIRSVSLSESSRPFRSSRQSLITKSVVARKSNSQTSSAPAADWLAGWPPSICCVLRGDEDRSGAGRSQSTGAENGPELNSFACR